MGHPVLGIVGLLDQAQIETVLFLKFVENIIHAKNHVFGYFFSI